MEERHEFFFINNNDLISMHKNDAKIYKCLASFCQEIHPAICLIKKRKEKKKKRKNPSSYP